jgi:hypothetical protein
MLLGALGPYRGREFTPISVVATGLVLVPGSAGDEGWGCLGAARNIFDTDELPTVPLTDIHKNGRPTEVKLDDGRIKKMVAMIPEHGGVLAIPLPLCLLDVLEPGRGLPYGGNGLG